MISLDDHSLQLQWDSSLIDKGFRDLESKFSRFNSKTIEPKVRMQGTTTGGQISDVARIKQEEQITRARIDAETKINSLRKIGGEEAAQNIKELEIVTSRLRMAQTSLAKATNRNDKEFKEYTLQLSKARLALSKVSHQTRGITREFNAQKFATSGLTQSLKNFARGWVSVFAIIAGGRYTLDVSKQLENMRNTLLMASGDAKTAAEDIIFLRKMSMEMGVSFLDSAKAYAKYSVAARGAGLTNQEMQQSFIDLSAAIRSTGLNQDDANLSFLALQQMLSNGVVSMEELRKQLSERMPQTMEVAKKALINLGYEFTSLKDLISTGTVESGPFVKEMTRLMAQQAKDTGAYAGALQTLEARQQRFNNALTFALEAFADMGFISGFGDLLDSLSDSLTWLKPVFKLLGAGFGVVFKMMSGIVDLVNLVLIPFGVLTDMIVDLGRILAGGFSKELEKDAYFANTLKRTWMLIAGYIQRAYGQFQILLGSLQVAASEILDSDNPFAILSPTTGRAIDATIKRSSEEGARRAEINRATNIQNNTFNIDGGNTSEVRDIVEGIVQRAYSGAG